MGHTLFQFKNTLNGDVAVELDSIDAVRRHDDDGHAFLSLTLDSGTFLDVEFSSSAEADHAHEALLLQLDSPGGPVEPKPRPSELFSEFFDIVLGPRKGRT